MPTNDFKPFGVGPGDDATPQAEYAAATWRVEGWRSGILLHEQINKVLRQTSTITAAIAQTVVDYTQQDLLDAGDLTTVTNRVKLAFSAYLAYNPAITYPAGTIGWAIQNGTGGGTGGLTADQIKTLLLGQLDVAQFTAGLVARINLIDTPTTGLVAKVADLQATYGSTAAAAVSAAAATAAEITATQRANEAAVSAGAALTSANNANSSQVAAATSAGNASTSATNAASSASSAAGSANAANTSATTASNSASAAAGSATAAATSATNAATSATTASTAATSATTSANTATTKAAEASTSATNAAGSATTAAGSAATASTKATQAANSESAAAGSAAAAATSATSATTQAGVATTQASLASTKALEANTSATNASTAATAAANSAASASSASAAASSSASAASGSSVTAAAAASSAQAALGQTARANMVWRGQILGAPNGNLSAIDIAGGLSGWGFRVVTGVGGASTGTLRQDNLAPGVAYSVSFKARLTAAGPLKVLNVDFFPDDLPEVFFDVTSTELTEFKWEGVSSSSSNMTGALLRFFSYSSAGANIEVTDIKLEQNGVATPFVINPRDVQFSAQAAATSASSATASATAASQSATAAQASRTAAETAQAAASSSQTQAANSATAAAGSASSASSSATTAANSATTAGAAATAANTSASSASTSATNANNSASAAAGWYNQTVSATGALSAAVTQEVATRADQVAGIHAQYALKVVATRPDGKKVFGYMGLQATAPNDNSGGQSEILLASDRLVFVPVSDPTATPAQPFVVGTVNGVTTLTVSQAVIGDLVISGRNLNLDTVETKHLKVGAASALAVSSVEYSGTGLDWTIGDNVAVKTARVYSRTVTTTGAPITMKGEVALAFTNFPAGVSYLSVSVDIRCDEVSTLPPQGPYPQGASLFYTDNFPVLRNGSGSYSGTNRVIPFTYTGAPIAGSHVFTVDVTVRTCNANGDYTNVNTNVESAAFTIATIFENKV